MIVSGVLAFEESFDNFEILKMLLVAIEYKSDNVGDFNITKKWYLLPDQLKATCVLLKMKAEKAKQEWPITTDTLKNS